MAQTDFAFSNDLRAAIELRTPKTARSTRPVAMS